MLWGDQVDQDHTAQDVQSDIGSALSDKEIFLHSNSLLHGGIGVVDTTCIKRFISIIDNLESYRP